MSTEPNAPRDIVEGGPERAPNGQEDGQPRSRQGGHVQPEQPGKRGSAGADRPDAGQGGARKDAPRHRDDVSYQPESGQLGAD